MKKLKNQNAEQIEKRKRDVREKHDLMNKESD